MKVLLTNKREFISKKGQEYVALSYLSIRDGKADSLLLTADKYHSFNLPQEAIMDIETKGLADSFRSATEVDIEFNSSGYLDNITV